MIVDWTLTRGKPSIARDRTTWSFLTNNNKGKFSVELWCVVNQPIRCSISISLLVKFYHLKIWCQLNWFDFFYQSAGDMWKACLGQLSELQQQALKQALEVESWLRPQSWTRARYSRVSRFHKKPRENRVPPAEILALFCMKCAFILLTPPCHENWKVLILYRVKTNKHDKIHRDWQCATATTHLVFLYLDGDCGRWNRGGR